VTNQLSWAASTTNRALGAAGVVGGTVLVAVFLPLPAWDASVNVIRIALFNLGAIAVIVAATRRQASATTRIALVIAAAAVISNAWYLAMVLIGLGRPQPPEPDPGFRLVEFYAGLAMWLADSAFGWVTLRIGVLTRWGSVFLAVGSLLAILGMSHLELTSPANPTIFGPLSLVGIALNGVGWILLGADLVIRDTHD
jgi:hypothetical protein